MELPDRCPNGHIVMIDWGNLAGSQISPLYRVEGYTCPICEAWKPMWFSTGQLDQNLKRLSELRPTHHSFWYYYCKAVKRAEQIQERGRKIYGEIGI